MMKMVSQKISSSSSIYLEWGGKKGGLFNPILHGGGDQIDPPRLIIVHQSSWNALNGLIFHDFVPFNIRKVLGMPFLKSFFENLKNFSLNDFFRLRSNGGDPSMQESKNQKSQFFLFQIPSYEPEYELYLF